VRRIEACTGIAAYERVKERQDTFTDACRLLKSPEEKFSAELEKRLQHIKELEKAVQSQKLDKVRQEAEAFVAGAETVAGKNFIGRVLSDMDMNLLRSAADAIKQKSSNCVIALGSSSDGKAALVVALTADLAKGTLNASKLVQAAAVLLGGSGGGRNDFAQAGGSKPENLKQAIEEIRKLL
jgi:alanyl-tRNA synthetase